MKRPSARHLLALPTACLAVGVACVSGGGGAVDGPSIDGLWRGQAMLLSSSARSTHTAATVSWCGSATQADLAPNVVAGYAVHWVYAIPSDGQNRFSTYASAMQADAESIASWWHSQDATRGPRNDLVQLSCGAQLDISSVRLPHSSADLRPESERFPTVASDLAGLGLESSFDKYLVYYDGPVDDTRLCGQGNTNPLLRGYAEVYVQSCPGVSVAVVAAHEMTHTFGAVQSGAPHMCPAPSDGHVCDSTTDLMYPFADGPLSAHSLDAGRDDYYGHGGSWWDVQDSPWLVQLDRQAPLTLTVTGSGSVVSDVPGLQCTATCTTSWNADTVVGLQATPAPGMKLVRWGGACSGSVVCRVTVAPGVAASALFAPATFRLSIRVGGRGTVRSTSGGIACPKRCSATVASYASIRLTAKPAKGWRFKSWQGSCRGKRAVCAVPMSADTSARAVFTRR
jgi:hypothetical protein